MAMADKDVLSLMGITINEDGSLSRPSLPEVQADESFSNGIASKDYTLDEHLGLSVRVFRPQNQASNNIIVYFHGGGFIFINTAMSLVHDFCSLIATNTEALVVSVNYRLAPENKLPAAYSDGFSVLKWLDRLFNTGNVHDPWLHLGARSPYRVHLAGDSAGGNIAHHVAIMAASRASELPSLKVASLVLIQPFFGSVARTTSEENNPHATSMCDTFWKLALPHGTDRDHEYCNVVSQLSTAHAQQLLSTTLVVVGDQDSLLDHQMEYVRARGIDDCLSLQAGHAFYTMPSLHGEIIHRMVNHVARFIHCVVTR